MLINMIHGFNVSWCWKEDDYKRVLQLINGCDKPLIHVCSGASEIGDIRLDARIIKVPDRAWRLGSCNVLGDMNNLPFKDSTAGTVICDPPYDYNFTDDTLINELVRICKPKAKIFFIAPWVPDSTIIKVMNTALWKVGKNRPYHKIMSVLTKSNGQISDYV